MTTDSAMLDNVLQLLEGLRKTTEGTILHGFITRGLRKFGESRIEAAFLVFADKLLDRYLANPESDPATRVRVKLIQMRLRPYLDELAPPAPAEPAAPAAVAPEAPPTTAPEARSIKMPETPPPSATTPAMPAATTDAAPKPATVRRSAFQASLSPRPAPAPAAAPPPAPPDLPVTPAIESLPEQLARQMSDTLTHGREFDELLRNSLTELSGRGVDVSAVKQQLARGIEELLSEHREMERELASRQRELDSMNAERRQLAQALDRARKHSLTDELTGLPNRNAFLRQLDAEIGRARRYGFSLALALIDIDDLKSINDRHGEAAGDSVLGTYAREIMSQFRGYDLVARYGGDEFALLLPNTQREGASRALDKAQKRVAGTYLQVNGRNLPLPSFSSVLTLYSHGEAPEMLLQRADEALAHAKQRGPAQTVVALPSG